VNWKQLVKAIAARTGHYLSLISKATSYAHCWQHGSLRSIELILAEVSFFAQAYEPPIVDLLTFMDENGFLLYDIAALAGRTRDNRLAQGDFVFARKDSALMEDGRWE
jgi:hypothetical protein